MARLSLGDPAPPFALPGVDGATHSLADYDGRPVAVVFSCCHCPYVVAWEDRLNELAREYDGRVGLMAVNANDHLGDSFADMRRRAEEKGFAFPFVRDESQEVARAYAAVRTPEVFLFDGDRRLVYHGAPDSNYADASGAEPWLRQAMDAVLEGGEPPIAETPPVGCTIKWREPSANPEL
jgi:peroxiredoxin